VDAANRGLLDVTLKNQTISNEKRLAGSGSVDGVTLSYTNEVFPTTSVNLLDVNYYDDYSYFNAPTSLEAVNGITPNANVKGLLTGAWTRILTNENERI